MQTEEIDNKEKLRESGRGGRPAVTPGRPRSEALMAEILDELRAVRRGQQHEDFSLGRLFGAVAQAFALCALGWAMWVVVEGTPQATTDAGLRLLFAAVLQMLALTCFANARK